MVYRGKDEEPKITWKRAVNFSNEFRLYNFNNAAMLPKPVKESKWIKPPLGCIKINIDTAWDKGRTGIGVIARDWDGFILGACFVSRKRWRVRSGLKGQLLVRGWSGSLTMRWTLSSLRATARVW